MPTKQTRVYSQYVASGYVTYDREPVAGFGNCKWFAMNVRFNTRPEALAWMKEQRNRWKPYNKFPVFSLRRETVEYWENLK